MKKNQLEKSEHREVKTMIQKKKKEKSIASLEGQKIKSV